MHDELWLWILAVAAGIIGSAMCSGLETGMYVLNRIRLELRSAANERQAARLARLLNQPRELLSVLLISNNAFNVLVSFGAVGLFALLGSDRPELLTSIIMTPMLFILGESLPKNLFRQAGEVLTYRLSWFLAGAAFLCRWTGLTWLVSGFGRVVLRLLHSEEDEPLAPRQRVGLVLAEARAHGTLSAVQSRIADRLIRLRVTRVAEVMVPLARVVSIPSDCNRERFMQVLGRNSFTRLPVWRDGPADIIGAANIYDVLYDEDTHAAPGKHVKDLPQLSPRLSVSRALMSLQQSRQAMGVIVENGRAVGIVTLKDLVEEIVGELKEW